MYCSWLAQPAAAIPTLWHASPPVLTWSSVTLNRADDLRLTSDATGLSTQQRKGANGMGNPARATPHHHHLFPRASFSLIAYSFTDGRILTGHKLRILHAYACDIPTLIPR